MLPLGDVIHLGITGIAQGCAYGLIALGFVLIYKATEVVNFAHGEFMMLGAFAVLTFSEALGWGFWPAFVFGCLSIASMFYRRYKGGKVARRFGGCYGPACELFLDMENR